MKNNSTNKKNDQQIQMSDEKDYKINGLQKSTKNLLNAVKYIEKDKEKEESSNQIENDRLKAEINLLEISKKHLIDELDTKSIEITEMNNN